MYKNNYPLSEPAVGPCLGDLASGLVRKLQGTEAKVSGPDAHGSPKTLWIPLRNVRPRKANELVQQSDDRPQMENLEHVVFLDIWS
jgi:hypothetical protein